MRPLFLMEEIDVLRTVAQRSSKMWHPGLFFTTDGVVNNLVGSTLNNYTKNIQNFREVLKVYLTSKTHLLKKFLMVMPESWDNIC
jgi:hypothetical protein